MIRLRIFKEQDLESLYSISLATGHVGGDATSLYKDGRMIGHIYSAPYAMLCPNFCFVAEDTTGVAGFIVGTIDTRSFEEQLELDWWPGLRAIYADPCNDPPSSWSADQRRSFMIHHPRRTPAEIVEAYPSHLHVNLLPRGQGQGIGSSLLDLWLLTARKSGATSVHVGTNAQNLRALRFWEKCGFEPIRAVSPSTESGPIWLGRHLDG
jgi:ribosomal protein S18 acetylase RimI-like enzyme